jgi:ATP-dependent helicase/nuclease subunit B
LISLSERSTGSGDRAAIVVSGSVAAQQWEAFLSATEVAAGTRAWETPPLLGYSVWLESLWLGGREPRPVPLSASQSLALWRRVIRDSAEGDELIGHRGLAEWAAEAWELLCNWRLDPARERADDSERDFAAFLGWCREYRRVLTDNGWIDHAEVARLLLTADWQAPSHVIFADSDEPSPLEQALLDRLARSGCRIEHRAPRAQAADLRRTTLADAAEELRAAVHWARRRLAATPAQRIAIVVSGLAERHGEIERALAENDRGSDAADGTPVWFGGSRLAANPRVAAAINALALCSHGATFESLSHWLRSPFFVAASADDGALRAALERELRRDIRAQLPFATAYRETALADILRRKVPAAAAALAAALQETAGISEATPSRWARAWQRCLTALGWNAPLDARALQHWQSAVDEFARLTPITGELSHAEAFAELERVLERARPELLPLRGIHVFARLDDVGPGYDAAWLTGFTDANWPEPARCNPLLPRRLQRAHGMPWSTPQDARTRSERRLERLAGRVTTVVASWPARMYDYETEPSPAIRSWQDLDSDDLCAPRRGAASRDRETVDDRPPPLLPGDPLRGGVGVLQRQAKCPVRAFCQDRLGARELDRVSAGLNARLRGNATHWALAFLLADLPLQADLERKRAEIPAAAARAMSDAFGDSRRPLQALFAIEVERLEAALQRAIDAELTRAPFTIAAVEQERVVTIAGRDLRIRLDRLDRLANGAFAIVDYKTGIRATISDWLEERPRDVQVPLYAAFADVPVGAAAIARVLPLESGYSGYWSAGAMYPNGREKFPVDRDWAGLLAQWRAALEELVLELAGGDTRIFVADSEDAAGAYAPLTRVHEQIALARGSSVRW